MKMFLKTWESFRQKGEVGLFKDKEECFKPSGLPTPTESLYSKALTKSPWQKPAPSPGRGHGLFSSYHTRMQEYAIGHEP